MGEVKEKREGKKLNRKGRLVKIQREREKGPQQNHNLDWSQVSKKWVNYR